MPALLAISVLLARFSGPASTSAWLWRPAATEDEAKRRLPAGVALGGGVLLAAGTVATLAGADSSRVSAFAFTGFLGPGGLDVLDRTRVGMVVVGLALVVGCSVVLFLRLLPDKRLPWAVPAIALAAVTASGIGTGLSLAITLGGASSRYDGVFLAGLAVVGGSAFGLVLGGWWLARGGASHAVAVAGSLVLGAATALGLVALSGAASFPSDMFVPAAALALSGFGGALVAVALRLVLAESAAHQRGLAAAAGAVAATFGSALGSLVGTGEATRSLTGDPNAISSGVVALVAAAVAAVVAALLMPSHRLAGG